MKKVLIIVLILLLIGLGLFFLLGGGKDKISNFFNEDADFGSFFDTDPQSQNEFVPVQDVATTTTPQVDGPYVAPVLRQISFEPVSGYTYYATTSTSTRVFVNPEEGDLTEEYLATSTAIRFQERGTGHIYDVFQFLQSPVKISNITIQKVYNTIFTNDPDEFIYQTMTLNNEQIKSVFSQIIHAEPETETSSSTEQTLLQKEISSAISDFAYLPSTDQLIFSNESSDGAQIYVSNPDRSTEKLLTTLPFKEFTILPVNSTQVLIQTNAAANQLGYAYAMNLSNGAFSKIAGNIAGLLLKPTSDLKNFLYSQSDLSRPILRTYDSASDTTRRIGLDTIPEKCSLSQVSPSQLYCFGSVIYGSAVYPDHWYMGKVFNSEDLYSIDLTTGEVQTVYIFEENEPDFDVINPTVTAFDDHMIFQNKYDLTLWAIDLETLRNRF